MTGLLFLSGLALAAETEMWTAAELEVESSKALSFAAAQHLRIGASGQQTAEALTDVGFELEALDHLELGAAYRIGMVDLGTAPESRHRLAFDATVPVRFEAWKLSLRQRYQVRLGTDHNRQRHTLRTRLKVKLDTDHLQPFVATEPFIEVGADGAAASKWRHTLGLDVPVAEQKLSTFYRLEHGLAESGVVHIVGLSFKAEVSRR